MKHYRKIDLYIKTSRRGEPWAYVASTCQSRTLREARQRFSAERGIPETAIRAYDTDRPGRTIR